MNLHPNTSSPDTPQFAQAKRASLLRVACWTIALLLPLLVVVSWALSAPTVHAQSEDEGYYYTVQIGDGWGGVARRTGISVAALQAANPQSIRYNLWLRTGERLFIPTGRPASDGDGVYHTVLAGEYWSGIASKYGVSMRLLQAANPRSVRSGLVLYRGERLFIPPEATNLPMPTPSDKEPTDEPTEEATEEPTEEATPEPTDEGPIYHTVQTGEGWGVIARDHGVTMGALQRANPQSVRRGLILYRGEQLLIPGTGEATPEPTEEPTEEPTDEPAPDPERVAFDAGESQKTIEGTIAAGGGSQQYLLEMSAGQAMSLVVDDTGATNTPPSFVVTSPSGTEWVNKVVAFDEVINFKTVATDEDGDYIVSLTSAEGAEEISYSAAFAVVTPDEDGAEPERIAFEAGATSSDTDGAILPTGTKQYVLEAAGGQTLEVRTNSGHAPVSFTVTSPSGAESASELLGSEVFIQFLQTELTEDGDYIISLSIPDDADPAFYDISFSVTGEAAPTEEDSGEEGAGDGEEETGDDSEGSGSEGSDGNDGDEGKTDVDTAGAELPEGCPTDFADYPDILLALLNSPQGGPEAFVGYLEACEALELYETSDWTADGVDDLVVVYKNPSGANAFAEYDLIIFNGTDDGFVQGYRARAAGEVNLLSTLDINEDGQADVSWIDTTCGASTCFDTVNIHSWDGETWADWTDGTITMAYTEVSLEDVRDEGSLFEVVLNGGLYGSVGAGPQRGRVEVWGSVDGAPYSLLDRSFNASECLYFAVVDGNNAFAEGTEASLEQAVTQYTKAATDENLKSCWVREEEETELRSFSHFRLALAAAYQADPAGATAEIDNLMATYPDSVYAEVGQVWLAAYQAGGSVSDACMATNEYAEDNPAAVEILADYGYTNPSFEASDVCPQLEIDVPVADTSLIVPSAAAAPEDAEEPAPEATTEPEEEPAGEEAPDDAEGAGTDESAPEATAEPEEEPASEDDSADSAADGTSADSTLPECPTVLEDYTDALTAVVDVADGDELVIETWMRLCDAMTDDRGSVTMRDVTGDENTDILLFPTIISDVGYGPDGAQGQVLVFHALEEGGYELAASPDIFGQPTLLTVDDVNEDGQQDVVWTVEGCSTFCVTEVQLASWDGEAYVVNIAPGATIAEGAPAFRDVSAADPGQGQELVLNGGVSGVPEGGLEVPHQEIWQSIDGEPYQRIRWTYDRDVEGNDCLGLRLIEADAALQASPHIGFDEAVQLYIDTLNPELKACSIFGTAEDEELILLQGLATFRLIQAQALSGDTEAATATLNALTQGQPDSDYTAAAEAWLTEYTASGDASAACEAVAPTFIDNDELWQITDQYGFNHPALAAEQICYAP